MNHKIPEWTAEDGIIDPETYAAESRKILWVLREPNGSDFDYLKYLRNPTVYRRWKASFGLVVQVSHAILNPHSRGQPLSNPARLVHDIMPRIALINLKKTGGKSRIHPHQFLAHALSNQQKILEQMIEINADMVIFAGTKRYLLPETIQALKEQLKKPVILLSAYHPNQKRIPHKVYVENLLAALDLHKPDPA